MRCAMSVHNHWLIRLLATAAVLPPLTFGVAGGAVAAAGFDHPLTIDNRLDPMRPGTQFVYDGTVTDADGMHPHRVVFTVTDMVKRVDGVDTRVIWDQDINDGQLTEAELAFFAQDNDGNVQTM